MSTTLNNQHRAVLDRIGQLAVADLVKLWRTLPSGQTTALVAALVEAVPELAARWGDVAAVSAADYFDAVREHYNPSGSYLASPAPPAPAEQVRAGVRWAVDPLFSASPDEAAALARLSTSLDRLVRQADRDTVAVNATADQHARGWRRVARPGACPFCVMLAGREGAYTSKAAAEMVGGSGRVRGTRPQGQSYHDHCRCFAAPVFPGWEPDADVLRAQELYEQAAVPGSTRDTLANMRRLMNT
ncbi:hypothetical protein EMG21_27800 [Klebsiella pneumoniae]|nr:hypothetical protein EMG21_27800 [Klebsiella pneumoniae]